MTLLRGRETTSDSPDPIAELLIQEARSRQRRRHRAMSAIACIAIVGLVLAYSAGGFSNPVRATRLLSQDPQVKPSASNNRSVIALNVPNLHGTRQGFGKVIAFGAESTWVLGETGVVRINGTTGKVQAVVPITSSSRIPSFAENLAFGRGDLWVESVVLESKGFDLSEIDPATNTIVRKVVVDGGSDGQLQQGYAGSFQTLAVESGNVLLAFQGHGGGELATVAAKTGSVTSISELPLDHSYPNFEVVNGQDVTMPVVGTLGQLMNTGNTIASTVFGKDVWASVMKTSSLNQLNYMLYEYSATTGDLLPASTKNVGLVASGDGELWGIQQSLNRTVYETNSQVIAQEHASLVEIDPSNGHVIRRLARPYPLGGPNVANSALAIGDGAAWIVEPITDVVYRVTL